MRQQERSRILEHRTEHPAYGSIHLGEFQMLLLADAFAVPCEIQRAIGFVRFAIEVRGFGDEMHSETPFCPSLAEIQADGTGNRRIWPVRAQRSSGGKRLLASNTLMAKQFAV